MYKKDRVMFTKTASGGLVASVYASHGVCRGFAHRPGENKDPHKNGTNCLRAWHACVRVVV